jgi:MFS family permease
MNVRLSPTVPVTLARRRARSLAGGLGQGVLAFRLPSFRRFWLGNVLSLVGSAMQSVSLPWLVLLLGGTPVELGVVAAMQFAPSLLLAPIGGVVADRVDKRRLLIGTQTVAMLEAAALFGLTVAGVVEIWHILVLAIVMGVAQALEMPARSAFVAELVPRDVLPNAVALSSVAFNGARVVGPAIGGVTIALFGVAANFGVNAVSFAAVLVGLAMIDPGSVRQPRAVAPGDRPGVVESLAEGLRFAAASPPIRWSLLLLLGLAVFGMQFTILIPLFARLELGLGAEGLGGLFAVYGLGSLVGSVLLAFRQERSVRLEVLGAAAVFVVAEIALGLSRWLPLVFALTAACGFFSIVFINTINVTIQNRVTDELRARVMSLYVLVLIGSAPFGALFAGGVAEALAPSAAFIVGAALAGGVLALAGWRLRAVP